VRNGGVIDEANLDDVGLPAPPKSRRCSVTSR
jgi:hypothetical protein